MFEPFLANFGEFLFYEVGGIKARTGRAGAPAPQPSLSKILFVRYRMRTSSRLSWTVQLEKSGAQSPTAVARFVRPSLGGLLNKTG
jgi:hypothetical protein